MILSWDENDFVCKILVFLIFLDLLFFGTIILDRGYTQKCSGKRLVEIFLTKVHQREHGAQKRYNSKDKSSDNPIDSKGYYILSFYY